MIRTRRSILAFALLALGTGCDALIGLGDEPAGAASTTSSTGDATSSSTSTSTTSTGDATSSSSGGGDVASASSAGGSGGAGNSSSGTGGDGAGGSGGQGGEGGSEPASPCGPCEEDRGCEECDASRTRCVRRFSTHDVWAAGDDVGSDVNRLGRGLAVTPAVVAFWALSEQDTPSVFVLDRATHVFTTIPFPRPDDDAKPFRAIGSVPGTGRVLVLDNAGGMLELVDQGDVWTLEQQDGYDLPQVGAFGGSLQGLHLVDISGISHKFDPTDGPAGNPCRVSNDSLGAAPIDARVELVGGDVTALSIGFGGVVTVDRTTTLLPVKVGRGGFNCADDDFAAIEITDLAWGLAVAAFGNNIYAKGTTNADGTGARVLELGADGIPTGRSLPSNRSRALLFRPGSALVPHPDGGLSVCTGLTGADCTLDPETAGMGDVKELVARPSGYVALGFRGEVEPTGGWGSAVVACVDER